MSTAAPNSKNHASRPNSSGGRDRGMTLVELLVASSIMALAVAAIASLASAAQSAAAYGGAHGSMVEQARMITARIRFS